MHSFLARRLLVGKPLLTVWRRPRPPGGKIWPLARGQRGFAQNFFFFFFFKTSPFQRFLLLPRKSEEDFP
jgi:hypothetical protein